MKNGLFWRLFCTLVGTQILMVLVLSFTMVTLLRAERQNAYEEEVMVQAREVAQLIEMRDVTSLWLSDLTGAPTLEWKIEEIRDHYQAEVWLVNIYGHALVLGTKDEQDRLNDPQVVEQIRRVLSGDEIRVQGLFSDLGSDIVTLGVPWYGMRDYVMGAVLLNISVSSLRVDYSDLVRYAVIAGVFTLLVGAFFSWMIAQRQSRPIKTINDAVTAFAAGDFDRRVEVKGEDDMAHLAASFNRMAEDISHLDQSRSSFVANVSHELRSPMTCIQGYVQGMLDGTISEEEKPRYLQTVLSETKRLSKLVGELLDLSRFESGKMPLNISSFDINEMILSVMFKYEQRIEEKHIDVEIVFKEQPLYVRADRDRITQVVTNLVDNAVKFTPDNAQITVWTHTVDNLAYVTVKNEGVGIPAEDLPFIFDRFYKVDKAHTSGMGTGLGLSIVKKILEQHGQTITASSSGSTTSFVFTLDRDEEKKDDKKRERNESNPEAETAQADAPGKEPN